MTSGAANTLHHQVFDHFWRAAEEHRAPVSAADNDAVGNLSHLHGGLPLIAGAAPAIDYLPLRALTPVARVCRTFSVSSKAMQGIGDRFTIFELRKRSFFLVAGFQVAFEHYAHDGLFTGRQLFGNVLCHDWLAVVVFR
jgi:hypothetical protein